MNQIFDSTPCLLGEGALWHPQRQTLFWFDILNKRMFERSLTQTKAAEWQFDECVSAVAWINENQLLIASESNLFKFDTISQKQEIIVALEADNTATRSNDGRADPYGGFWIGTMGKKAEKSAGSIYRWYKGELRKLFSGITIPNSICFAPTGGKAYYCDTPTKMIMSVATDNYGWPVGEPRIHIDLRETSFNPDGSVVDMQGNLWNAQWGASRIACYNKEGCFVKAQRFEASQISCPAFGGGDLSLLFATSASENLADPKSENAGSVFISDTQKVKGQLEHRVVVG